MNYSERIQDLQSRLAFQMSNYAPHRTEAILKRLKNPHQQLPKIVHIAGTNGKGSVSWKVARNCVLEGKKTGLFTSPHLFCFRERIRVNGESITEEEVLLGLEEIAAAEREEGLHLSFFEYTTLLAFWFFAKYRIEIAVIETGLGGRLDATNVVQPTLTAITSIGLDHTAVLGESLASIAREKAGIIKPGVPLVVGPTAAHPLILERAERVYTVQGEWSWYDEENQEIARTLLELLQIPVRDLEARPPGRFFCKEDVCIDVAHNPAGCRALRQAINHHFPKKRVAVVASFAKDKDVAGCVAHLKPWPLFFAKIAWDRSLPAKRSVQEAIDAARKDNPELLLIMGSHRMMTEAWQALGWDA